MAPRREKTLNDESNTLELFDLLWYVTFAYERNDFQEVMDLPFELLEVKEDQSKRKPHLVLWFMYYCLDICE